MNFHYIMQILHCGDAVKVVKRIGSLKSSYLLYLDHIPYEVIHLGIEQDASGGWHPEPLLVLQRNVTAYINGQLPLGIVTLNLRLSLKRRTPKKITGKSSEAGRRNEGFGFFPHPIYGKIGECKPKLSKCKPKVVYKKMAQFKIRRRKR